MPSYIVKIETDVTLFRQDLDVIEDVVYDTIVDGFGGSAEVLADGGGFTDVEAVYN